MEKEFSEIEKRSPRIFEEEVREMIEEISREADKLGQAHGVSIDVSLDGNVYYGQMDKSTRTIVKTEMKRIFREYAKKALTRMLIRETMYMEV